MASGCYSPLRQKRREHQGMCRSQRPYKIAQYVELARCLVDFCGWYVPIEKYAHSQWARPILWSPMQLYYVRLECMTRGL